MSVIATAVRHMLAAGMPHDQIVAAVAEMEASLAPQRTARQERNRRYYEAHKEELKARRLKTSEIKTSETSEIQTFKTLSDGLVPPDKEAPQTPKEINPLPAHEGSAREREERGQILILAEKRKHRLPKDFELTNERLNRGLRYLQTEERVRHEFEKFRNHFGGNGASKLNWDLTLTNWFINAAEGKFGPRQPAVGGGGQQRGTVFGAACRAISEIQASRGPDHRDELDLPF